MTKHLEVVYPDSFRDSVLLAPIAPNKVDTSPIADYAAENNYRPKDEYHLTIIGSRDVVDELRAQLEKLAPAERRQRKAKLDALIPVLGAARLREGKYHYVVKTYNDDGISETREALIQEAEIDGISDFYAEFSRITDIELGTPFPHLTLFTKGNSSNSAKGIGIASAEVFSRMEHEALELLPQGKVS